jgi:predicted dehydrogenase
MILLIGSGPMAVEYARVLKAQNRPFTVIGRGMASGAEFSKKIGQQVITGGLDASISSGRVTRASTAIVAVGVEALYETTKTLLEHGVKRLLIEKPGVMHPHQIGPLREASHKSGAEVYIAYNRRFLSSVRRTREIIEANGGLTSFTFDFTEWGHEIAPLAKASGVKELWVLGNSSHVLDLAFHLGGIPSQINTVQSGEINWHPAGASFVGSGITVKGIPFSYHANWDAPGRWGLELCTRLHKIILRPMEKLQVMRRGSVQIEEMSVDIDDANLDALYKPGLYRQVESFFSEDTGQLCTLDELHAQLGHFCSIAGYKY